MMRYIWYKLLVVITVWFLSVSSMLLASPRITWQVHNFMDKDTLIRHTLDYCEPGASGKGVVWDFSNIQVSDKTDKVSWNLQDDSVWCVKERRTSRYYVNRADTLWQVRLQTATTYMDYSMEEVLLKYPMDYGDTLSSNFIATGQHGKLMPIKQHGCNRVCVDATGKLILPDTEYDDVIRIKQMRKIFTQENDTLPLVVERYAWYASMCRYPVLESERMLQNDSVFYSVSFYTPQEKLVETDDSLDDISMEHVFTNASFLPNPVQDRLFIHYELTRNAYVGFALYTPLGVLIHQKGAQIQPVGYHEYSIPMMGQITGSYTLYIFVDDKVIQQVIVKQ